MSAATTQVEPEIDEVTASNPNESPTSKEFQEKYYPILPTSINKYDPYTL